MAIELIGIPQEQMIVYETTLDDCYVHYQIQQIVQQADDDFEEFLKRLSGSLGVKHWTDNPQA